MKFKATERAWVMRLLARLSPAQRLRYEATCREAPRHYRSGKLYDHAKAEIAERILYEDSVGPRVRAGDR
jgi:hypothetical protein